MFMGLVNQSKIILKISETFLRKFDICFFLPLIYNEYFYICTKTGFGNTQLKH